MKAHSLTTKHITAAISQRICKHGTLKAEKEWYDFNYMSDEEKEKEYIFLKETALPGIAIVFTVMIFLCFGIVCCVVVPTFVVFYK